MKIYVASSWRNTIQPHVVHALRQAGHEVFDFRHPQTILPDGTLGNETDATFGWEDIDEDYEDWSNQDYLNALTHPVAKRAYKTDHGGMEWSDAGVLVLPCGASAHTEIGYYDGAGKPAFVLLPDEGVRPELMYKSFIICPALDDLVKAVSAHDPRSREWRAVARVTLDLDVEVRLDFPSNFDEAALLAQNEAERSLSDFRSRTGLITDVEVIEANAYRVERKKR